MTTGLQVYNNSSKLVLAAEGNSYFYYGNASLYSSGSVGAFRAYDYHGQPYDPGEVTPYIYRITLPSGLTKPPIITFEVSNGRVTSIKSVKHIGSNIWEIEIWSVSRASAGNSFLTTYSVVSPGTIKVFLPFLVSGSSGVGLQLFNSSGALSFDTSQKPLWLKEKVSFDDSDIEASWSGTSSSLLVFAGMAGFITRFIPYSDRTIYRGWDGYTYDGTAMKRHWFLVYHDNYPLNGTDPETGELPPFGGVQDQHFYGPTAVYVANSLLY